MWILIVEDEKPLADIIKKGLEEENYTVDVVYNGEEGLFMAEQEAFDLIILDIMLPVIDGITIVNHIRRAGIKTPVIMLTAKDTITDKVTGLNSGADDYLTKPFFFEELLARIRALIRRNLITNPVIEIEDLIINTVTHEVKRDGKEIMLLPKEYILLEYMAMNKNQVLSRTAISEHVYGYNYDFDSNVIDVHINRLRNKIDKDFKVNLIHTVRGFGYMLKG